MTQQWTRLITAPARSTALHSNRRILHRSECLPPHPAQHCDVHQHTSISNFQHDIMTAQHDTGCVYHLFTDGSYTVPDLPPSAILDSELSRRREGRATAAIVALSDQRNWQQHPAIVLYITAGDHFQPAGSSAYIAELLALVIAVQIVTQLRTAGTPVPTIHSDCKAAIATIRAAASPYGNKRPVHSTHILTDTLSNVTLPRLHWTRSHPERRTRDQLRWTFHDWGIHLADLAAGALHCRNTMLNRFPSYIKLISVQPYAP